MKKLIFEINCEDRFCGACDFLILKFGEPECNLFSLELDYNGEDSLDVLRADECLGKEVSNENR